jgi:hypothetical protein
MTWKELKEFMDEHGVKDDETIRVLDILTDSKKDDLHFESQPDGIKVY